MPPFFERLDFLERGLKLPRRRLRNGRRLVDWRIQVDHPKLPAFLLRNSLSYFGKLHLGVTASPGLHFDDDPTLRALSNRVWTKVPEKLRHDFSRRIYVELHPTGFKV